MKQELRRKVIKGLVITLPAIWVTPVVESVILPAHAGTSPSEPNPFAGTYTDSRPNGGFGSGNCPDNDHNDWGDAHQSGITIVIDDSGNVSVTIQDAPLTGNGVLTGNTFSFGITGSFNLNSSTGCTYSGTVDGTISGSTITGNYAGSGSCTSGCTNLQNSGTTYSASLET